MQRYRRKSTKRKKDRLRRLAKAYYALTDLYLKILNFIGKKIGMKDLNCNLLMPYCEAIEKESSCYVTYDLCPKAARDLDSHLTYESQCASEICIVMQGPILAKSNFTLETVRYYSKVFPGVLVVVSTWKDEDEEQICKLRNEENCVVVLNDYPENHGPGNSNLQCISSLGGILEAKLREKKFILKTRSDTRITTKGVLEVLHQYIEQYPVKNNTSQRKRLILFSTFLFHPYHAGDLFCFGQVDDLENYYDKTQDKENTTTVDANYMIDNRWSYRKAFEYPGGENEINIKYFAKLNGKATCDLGEWWRVISESIIALPLSFLKPIWLKYDYNHEESNFTMSYRRNIMGAAGADNTTVDFAMWLDMYQNAFLLQPQDYAFYLDVPMS